jgi:small multidrug resistance pump
MVVIGYVTAFYLLAKVMRAGMPIAVAYGIWGALGTALTAGIAVAIFGEKLTAPIIAGITLIIGGVLMVEFGSHPRTTEDVAS